MERESVSIKVWKLRGEGEGVASNSQRLLLKIKILALKIINKNAYRKFRANGVCIL